MARLCQCFWLSFLFGLLCAVSRAYATHSEGARRRQSFSLRIESRDKNWGRPSERRRAQQLRNATMPLHGAVKDYGYFYANLYLGTPPQRFAVIVDTGSTMTYVPCASCGEPCGHNHQNTAFDPASSSSASMVQCGSPQCACGSPRCGCSAGHCTYTRSYAEQSSSAGQLVSDLLALHDGGPGAPIVFGCETSETGEIYKQRADGLIGLGNSDASVVNQLVKAGTIADTFSLCFGSVEGNGALLLGDAPLPPSLPPLVHTPLVANRAHPFYYNVRLSGISVAGTRLDVQPALYTSGYGTVLDSGTTFTYIPSPAFRAFVVAVETYALAAGLRRVTGPEKEYDDICYGGAPADHRDEEGLARVFPPLSLAFDGGANLTLGPLNYLFVHTFGSGKYCLGVFDNGGTGTLLGGITFRNVLVKYDRGNKRVGFVPAQCKGLGEATRPPCSAFASGAGAPSLEALQAAADGDCSPVDDGARQQQEQAGSSSGGSKGSGGISQASGGAGGQASAQPASSTSGSSQQQEIRTSQQQGGSSSNRADRGIPTAAIVAAAVVGVAAVSAVVAAVLLLQAGRREQLRGLLPGTRLRPLSEPGPDPEAASLMSNMAGPSAVQPPPAAKQQQQQPRELRVIPLADLGSMAGGGDGGASSGRTPGRTTPQKLARSGSSVTAEEGAAAVGASLRMSLSLGASQSGGISGGSASLSPR